MENFWIAVSAIAAVIALIISAISLTLSVKSLKWEREGAEAATRSADAAEEANRLLSEQITQHPTPPPTEPTDITLELTHISGARWILRNKGTDTATGISLTGIPSGVMSRNIPSSATLRPNEGRDIILQGTFGSPLPNQLWASWDGLNDHVAVPLVK